VKESRQLGYGHKNFGKYMTLTDAMLVFHGQPTGPKVPVTMVLNPEFIERLLGIPEGWTRVTDEHALQLWETR
jgi:hypothetical protein